VFAQNPAPPDSKTKTKRVESPPAAAPDETPARPKAPATERKPATDERPTAEDRPQKPARADEPATPDRPQKPARRDDAAARDEKPRTEENDRGQRRERQGLGIEFDDGAEAGLTIGSLEDNSTAAQAGFRQGDRIVSIDGRTFRSPRQFQAYLSGQYGRRVPVIIDRGGRQYTVQLAMNEPEGDVAWLGVFLNDNEENQRGAPVTQVYPAGPAARAGVRPGDVIMQVNGEEVAGSAELIEAIEELEPRAKAELTIARGQREMPLTVVLGSRQSFVDFGQDEQFGQRQGSGDDGSEWFSNIPPHAMQLEHDRRMAEQHQRIEEELRKLQDEVRQLREALQARK
jgi:hypothetical protein